MTGDLALDMTVAALHNEPSKPCLVLRPRGTDPAFAIRIFPSLAPDAFPWRKLRADRNAVRPRHYPGAPPAALGAAGALTCGLRRYRALLEGGAGVTGCGPALLT